ncbi:MAG: glycerol-3-phosphate 1-O-acyltransferase PlsY [Chloroflexi bacterium]|nr:MAG: glycerol-3-phosphate 1-O-acyltransferase PlsY [Chloroflexota bacterium]
MADITGFVAGYMVGSVPVGLLLGRAARGLDVRDFGSGNIGATNVYRIMGPAAGALTFAMDVGKGAAAVRLARGFGADRTGQAAAGFAAVVGHSWPAFARFRGGKGVATGFGGLLLVSREASAFAVVGGLSALAATRIVSVGSLSAGASATFGAALRRMRSGDMVPLAFAALTTTLLAVRHGDNLRRLAHGQEPRVSLRRSADAQGATDRN